MSFSLPSPTFATMLHALGTMPDISIIMLDGFITLSWDELHY